MLLGGGGALVVVGLACGLGWWMVRRRAQYAI
jgi:hypothetical protein